MDITAGDQEEYAKKPRTFSIGERQKHTTESPLRKVHKSKKKIFKFLPMAVFFYILTGILFYTLSDENMSLFQAIYFLTISMTTIGYGDLSPDTPEGKIFHSVYVFVGLGIVSGGVSWLLEHLLEERDRIMANDACRNLEAQEGQAIVKSQSRESIGNTADLYCLPFWHDILKISPHVDMRNILNAIALIFFNVGIGTLFYTCIVERMPVIDAIYLSSMTVTTIGLGDKTPTNFNSRLFTIFYAIFGTLMTARSLSQISAVFFRYMRLKKEELLFDRMMHISTFLDMANGADNVTKERFVLYKLLLLDLVDIKVINKAESQFEKFDTEHKGVISAKDVCALPVLPRRKETNISRLARRESEGENGRVRSNSLLTEIRDRLSSEQFQLDVLVPMECVDEVDLEEELELELVDIDDDMECRGRRNTLMDVVKYIHRDS